MKIKLDRADQLFSQYIRLRDKMCQRCKSPVRLNEKGLPVSHQNSHYFGRGKESTRFDLENCDTLCHGCHQHWGSADKEGYRGFKIKQLGQRGFQLLELRSNSYTKKDRKLQVILWKQQLKEDYNV